MLDAAVLAMAERAERSCAGGVDAVSALDAREAIQRMLGEARVRRGVGGGPFVWETVMFKRILIAIDETKLAERVVDVAASLATELAADVAIVHVIDESRAYILDLAVLDEVLISNLRSDGVAALDSAYRRMPADLSVQRKLVQGDPSEMIITTAENWQADLIVLGNDSRGRLAHFLLGSTADSVIRRAPCPVVTVRGGGKAADDQPTAHAVAGV